MPTDPSLPRTLELAFAPVHKRALGIAVGLVAGLAVAFITALVVLGAPPEAPNLELLDEDFFGYTVSLKGVLVGGLWGFLTGFVAGWFAAFVRNCVVAAWLLVVRAKAGLSNSFLDHI